MNDRQLKELLEKKGTPLYSLRRRPAAASGTDAAAGPSQPGPPLLCR